MSARPATLPDVDISSFDLYAERIPHEEFKRLRREAPVSWHHEPDGPGFWAVTRWDDLVAVHRDPSTFSSEIGAVELEDLEADALDARRTMLETDPPDHTRLRRIVSRAFRRREVERGAAAARAIVRDTLDEGLEDGELDFVERVSHEVPIRVLCPILGVPRDEADQLFAWADSVIYHADPDFTEVVYDRDDTDPYRLLPFRSPVALEVFDYCDHLAAKRRAHPADDVVTSLVAARDGGEVRTDRQLHTFFLLLVIAGNETTRHALSHGLLALLENPEQLARLRADPSLLPTATEEVLRWATPQIHFRRTATRNTEIRGQPIDEGDKVVVWYLSANYDGDVFEDPYRFDVGRTPNEHVTFGSGGPHFCLGSWLARLEVRLTLEELLRRVASIELAGHPERVRSNFINGLKRLPVSVRLA